MWDCDGSMGWWWMFPMTIFWVTVVGLVVWGISRATGGRERHLATDESPMEIARMRFARGEITREQFEEIRRTL